MPNGELKKILIIRLSSIGDIILTTPVIRLLRKRFPEAHIDYLTKSRFAGLLRHDPQIDRLIEFPETGTLKNLFQIRHFLREQNYNVIIDLHKNFRSLILSVRQNTKFTGRLRKYGWPRFNLVKFGRDIYCSVQPVLQRYIDVAAPLQIIDDGAGTELFLAQEDHSGFQHKSGLGQETRNPIIALAPGAGYFSKRWPLENYQKIAAEIIKNGKTCLVLGGPEDRRLGETIKKAAPEIIDLTGKLSLRQSAAALKTATRLITNDTGLMHMAEAVKTPVTAIFGSTVRQLGFYPFLPQSRVFENLQLSCRPCSHVGRPNCPQGHFLCMKSTKPQAVSESLK